MGNFVRMGVVWASQDIARGREGWDLFSCLSVGSVGDAYGHLSEILSWGGGHLPYKLCPEGKEVGGAFQFKSRFTPGFFF